MICVRRGRRSPGDRRHARGLGDGTPKPVEVLRSTREPEPDESHTQQRRPTVATGHQIPDARRRDCRFDDDLAIDLAQDPAKDPEG